MITQKHIIVVGAGIAGLAAARSLRKLGFAVSVLEAAARPGGRIKSIEFYGHQIEVGAQFSSTGYRYIPALAREHGLASKFRRLSARAALQRGARLYPVHARKPWAPLASGLLNWGEFLKLGLGSTRLAWHARGINPNCFAEFSTLDDSDAATWCRNNLGPAAAAHIIEPMIHGLYFHRLCGTSRALIAAILAFRGADSLAVAGGWQQLPQSLAARLDVQYGTKIERLESNVDGVRLWANGARLATHRADAAVLAVPAHVARSILVEPIPSEDKLLLSEYASTVHIALGMDPNWRPPEYMLGVYGCLLAPIEGGRIAALTLEGGRGLRRGEGEVVSIMLGHGAASRMCKLSDDAIVRDILDELENWLPSVKCSVRCSHVQRWEAAEPFSPVGRAAAIAEYRATLSTTRRIVLAGDFLGTPWTDGAAETGFWAAQHLATVYGHDGPALEHIDLGDQSRLVVRLTAAHGRSENRCVGGYNPRTMPPRNHPRRALDSQK